MGAIDSDRLARVALNLLQLPGDDRIGVLVQQFGCQETVGQLQSGHGPQRACTRITDAVNRTAAVLKFAQQCNIDFITPDDDQWPSQLNDLDTESPIGLWVRGSTALTELTASSLSLVGARAATAYGQRIASELGTMASDAGMCVISGAAFGIDASAHRGALAAGGTTIAVLACGVDVAYPSAHQGLLDRIAQSGAIVSELPPGASPRKQHFLVRNRIIAALAPQTVVVEAALRSGALSTAHWAQDLGRIVWGVPGPITSASSAGINKEIGKGFMRIMANMEDVLHEPI